MGEILGFIWRDHFPPFFSPAAIPYPLPGGRRPPELTCATPRPDTLVPDGSHAHGSRPRSAPDYPSHQLVTGRRCTGLTVTFSRPAAEQAHPPFESRGGHTRSLFRTAVGHSSLGHAHSPHGAGAGAGCALSRSSWAATLAHRPRSCGNQGHFPTPAASPVHEGDPMSSPRRLRHPRPCHWAGHRCRRLIERPQPSWPIRIGPHRTSGRCALAS